MSPRWQFPPPDRADRRGLVAVGADLEPDTLLQAYSSGLFPMPFGRERRGRIGWWSPDPRGIIPLDGLVVTKSLRRSVKRYEVRFDTSFEAVVRACADPQRPHGWITEPFVEAYTRLHRLGYGHSVEAWQGDELVGGLYGVRVGRLFAGESMFHTAVDASKVSLVALVEWLRASDAALLDVQWHTPHLATLGAVEVTRDEYLCRLAEAVS